MIAAGEREHTRIFPGEIFESSTTSASSVVPLQSHPPWPSFSVACDETIARIERRIATWTFLPEENGESMQILHYENGQKYEPHYDYFHDKANQQFVAIGLPYLSTVRKGGETFFSESRVKPEKGDALLFFSLHTDATTDSDSLHGSCPVIGGEKWSATKWIHVKSFDRAERK